VKSDVETLNPTRVKLTVEVGFDELRSSLDGAYRRIGQRVQIPGFRRGKVPARILDQRVGRAAVLEDAVNDALPVLYAQAVREHELLPLGRPEVEVTELADNDKLAFSAEVDVRPEVTVPDYDGLQVTVEDAEVTEDEVDTEVTRLRERFASLTGVDRAAGDGDFVSLDLSATRDGQKLDGVEATGLSYQVGSGTMLDGLDDAVRGQQAGAVVTFATELLGEYQGQSADVTVTVESVKEQVLPELDDELASLASEFDTLDELKQNIRTQMGSRKQYQQQVQARDKVVEALLDRVEVPVPDAVMHDEAHARRHGIEEQLQRAQLSLSQYLSRQGQTEEQFDAELHQRAEVSLRSQFLLDAIAKAEQVQVSEEDLSAAIVQLAAQSGLQPEQYAQQVLQGGQINEVVGQIAREKALGVVLGHVTVTDASGRTVDTAPEPTVTDTVLDGDAVVPDHGPAADGPDAADAGPVAQPAPAIAVGEAEVESGS
jgi:trigger factor